MARVVLGLLVSGAVALFAVTRSWASATVRTPGLPTDRISVSGVDAAPILVAVALVILAAALAVVAAGGWFRQLVGFGTAAVAGFAALRALSLDIDGAPLANAVRLSPSFLGDVQPHVSVAPWPVVAAVAFGVASVLGLVVVVRGRAWARMAARYDRVPASEPDCRFTDDPWRAQDHGHDPTL